MAGAAPQIACRRCFVAFARTDLVRGYCSACLKQVTPDADVKPFRTQTDKRYHTAAWERFSKTVRALNPVCQVIEHGQQCRYKSCLVHHLVSPYQGGRFMDPANVVAICSFHHTPTEGESKTDPHTYAPTKFILNTEYPHLPHS